MATVLILLYTVFLYLRPFERDVSLAAYRPMLVLGVTTFLAAVVGMPFTRPSLRAPQVWLVSLFAICIGMSRVVALRWIGGGVAAVVDFSVTLLYFYMLVMGFNSLGKLRLLFATMAVCSLIQMAEGFAALHYGYLGDKLVLTQITQRFSDGGTMEILRIRGLGYVNDPNDLAQSFLTVMPFIGLAWKKRAIVNNLLIVVIPNLLLLYGIYLTRSRGAVLSLFIMGAFWLRTRLVGMMASVVLGAMVFSLAFASLLGGRALSTADESITGRFEAWSAGLQLMKSYPLFGVGYKFFIDHHELTAHNSFVLCFSEVGLIGYLVWVALLYVTLTQVGALVKIPGQTQSASRLKRYAAATQLSMVGFLVSAWFLSRTYNLVLFLLIGVVVSLVGMARNEQLMPEPPPAAKQLMYVVGLAGAAVAAIYLSVILAVR